MLKTRVFLVTLVAVVIASTASGSSIYQWGDFTVKGKKSVIAVDAWAFDDEKVNPPGFPPPSKVLPLRCYPGLFAGSLKVKELRDFYTSQGVPNNTFALLWKNGRKPTILLGLLVKISGSLVATADVITDGKFILPANSKLAFMTNINLNNFNDNDKIKICYVDGLCPSLKKVRFAATPEPISMAFLGTGLLGTILVRARSKKRS